ncbi:hypothetical protein Fmac_017091 [Flemingia macrophylla]|uniref:Uncharacterized protein n=1 Tax=Flemingia macrophylla TaxID=520843 RepID=A0ABD1M303_9FABA
MNETQHSNNSDDNNNNNVSLQPIFFSMQSFLAMDLERGPRYEAYSELREAKLRMRYLRQQQYDEMEMETETETKAATPPRKKQVKFQGGGRKGSSLVAQSVPDFGAALRKENRKPNVLPALMELTPPSKSVCGSANARGSKSASAGEKRRVGGGVGGVLMPRKSYATIDELKGLSSSTANAINGESRGGGVRSSRLMAARKSVLGYRQI